MQQLTTLHKQAHRYAFAHYLRTGHIPPVISRLLAVTTLALKANYNPNQPRIPAGNPDGGQWSDGFVNGGTTGSGYNHAPYTQLPPTPDIYEPPIESVYPEVLIGSLSTLGTQGSKLFVKLISRGLAAYSSSKKIRRAFKELENYFGGLPDIFERKSKGDIYIMKNNSKIRFNIEDPHGYDPHFHIEKGVYNGRKIEWEDVGEHMYLFTKE